MVTIQFDDEIGKEIQARARKRKMSVEKYVFFLSQNEELWGDIEEAFSEKSMSLDSPEALLMLSK
ncbi:hypothetical protein K9L63_01855 [Candidatus Gracilibacteria bacterium]|nr:hypothetical protein [Candidatus Gracilibacteria bacterium]